MSLCCQPGLESGPMDVMGCTKFHMLPLANNVRQEKSGCYVNLFPISLTRVVAQSMCLMICNIARI